MGDRARAVPHYAGAAPKPASPAAASDDLGPRKTLLVLVVVTGCFAVLWPKLFYPMLVANANKHIQPSPIDKTTGCCDVISDTDVATIKIMTELCGSIARAKPGAAPTGPQMVGECRRAVLETCGIDISAALQERVDLGHSLRQILEEVRSLNGSLCLKYNFGVSPSRLGVPHRVTAGRYGESIRQERPSHLRSELVHPAFRERGRAIPHTEGAQRRDKPPPRIVEGRPGPLPGLRPTMGGAGHVVPAKQQGTGVMGLLMPLYTVGIVVFFTYTVMKLAFKKKPEPYPGAHLYPPVVPDENFRKEVFESDLGLLSRITSRESNSKIVVDAVSALLDEVDRELGARGRPLVQDSIDEQDETLANGSAVKPQEPSVHIMGMETRTSCEDGRKWSRPESPVVSPSAHRGNQLPIEAEPPQEIYLEGALPPQSQLLVSDSATEAQKTSEEDPAVVLAGKMTLSVISLDSTENGSDEEKRTPGSHTSEEFEKIDAEHIEDQIDDIIDEAQSTIGVKLDNGKSFLEEIERMNREIKEDIEKRKTKPTDILEEIKHELALEDDLLDALKYEEERVDTPASDIVKQFLDKEVTESEAQLVEEPTLEKSTVITDKKEQYTSKDEVEVNKTIEELVTKEEIVPQNIYISGEISKAIDDIVDSTEQTKESVEINKVMKEVVDNDIQKAQDEITPKTSSACEKICQEGSQVADKQVEQALQKNEDIKKPVEELVLVKEAKVIEEGKPQAGDIRGRIVEATKDVAGIEPSIVQVNEKSLEETAKVSEVKSSEVEGLAFDISDEISKIIGDLTINQDAEQCTSKNEEVLKTVEPIVQAEDVERVKRDLSKSFEDVKVENEGSDILKNVLEEIAKAEEAFRAKVEIDELEDKTAENYVPEVSDHETASIATESISQETKDTEQRSSDNAAEKLLRAIEETKTFEEAVAVPTDFFEDPKTEESIEILLEESKESQLIPKDVAKEVATEESSIKTVEQAAAPQDDCRNVPEEASAEEEVDEEGHEAVIEEIEYEDESEEEEEDDQEEIGILERVPVERMNGDDLDQSKHGTTSSTTTAEHEISEEENEDEDEDDEEIEEIIEYVDNTDEEGEEIIEVNEVVNHLDNGNARHEHH